jgi:hypothetical protein
VRGLLIAQQLGTQTVISAPTRRCEATAGLGKTRNLSEARRGQLTNAALTAWFAARRYTKSERKAPELLPGL